MNSPHRIIAVHGFKQSGKDTLAHLLVHEYGYTRYAFADRVKESLHVIFGIAREDLFGSDEDKQKLSPLRWEDLQGVQREHRDHESYLSIRELLQIFATEICRDKIPSIWFRYLPLPSDKKIVISDLRFDDEAQYLKSLGATIVKVDRPQARATQHASESGICTNFIDHCLSNDGSLEQFYHAARQCMDRLGLQKPQI